MALRSLGVRLGAWLVIAVGAQACAQTPEQPLAAASGCSARIIVGFHAPADATEVAALAASHALTLSIVNRLLPDLYVLDLDVRGDAAACAAALERLRADVRVRSVELDARRSPHAG
jgi:riboflavin synthase